MASKTAFAKAREPSVSPQQSAYRALEPSNTEPIWDGAICKINATFPKSLPLQGKVARLKAVTEEVVPPPKV